MAYNRVKIGNTVVMDITNQNATTAVVLAKDADDNDVYFYDKNGDRLQGACTYNADTTDDDVIAAHVKSGDTFHLADGSSSTGTLTWKDATEEVTLSTTLPSALSAAYYPGVSFTIDNTVIKADNIRNNITILGVQGTYEGTETVEATKYARAATDYTGSGTRYDTISPSEGYTALANVKVGKIWYEDSATSGTTGYTANIISLTES